jgi:hypothetical protein
MELVIDPELRDLIPPLEEAERAKLEASLRKDGCLDSLKIWRDGDRQVLLDGHNRKEICDRLDVPYRVEEVASVTNRYEAIQWMIDLQLSRRNLTPERKSYLRGRRYNEEKRAHGAEPGGRGNQHLVRYHNDTLRTREALAKEYGVGSATIVRDAVFAEAIDALPSEERVEVLSGRSAKTKTQVIRDHLIATGQRKPPTEKPIEKIYRTDTHKALDMLDYHMRVGNREIKLEILTEILRFLHGDLLEPGDVDRIWNQIRREESNGKIDADNR